MKTTSIIALILTSAWTAAAHAGPACGLLSQAEAEQFLGGPIGPPSEDRPKEGGGGVITTCNFLPKGYDADKADGPPDHGLELSQHTLKTAELARKRYDWSYAQSKDIKSTLAAHQFPKDKISVLKGLGDDAFVIDRDAAFNTAQIYVLKGNSMVRVQVWKNAGSATKAGTAVAKQVIARLP